MIEIFDTGPDDHADAGAVEHDVERQQRDSHDAEQCEAIGRVEHEADRRNTYKRRRRRHSFRQAAKEEAHSLDEDDAEAEGDQDLVFARAAVKVADNQAFHQHADDHNEQRAGDEGDDKGAGETIAEPAGIAAEHEHSAVREVEHAERAVNDRQAGRNQRQQRAEHQPIETLRDEIRPIYQGRPRLLTARPGRSAARLRGAL